MWPSLTEQIQGVIRRAPETWLRGVCSTLSTVPMATSADALKKRLPPTGNADLAFLLHEVIDRAAGKVSWEALGYGLQNAYETYRALETNRRIEMLWSGPTPADHLAARRIDQALYDLIGSAEREILLVTFAAVKIDRLAVALIKAVEREVRVRLVLEFAEASEGQLSFDALTAFPSALVSCAEVYYWPVENRERNQAGRPGKLHAKLALIDDTLLVSSANLTDDAFTRNLELGAMITDPSVVKWARDYFNSLINDFTLVRVPGL